LEHGRKNRSISFDPELFIFGGRESLHIEINVNLQSCGGCPYCNFPYIAEVPISGVGQKEFKSEDDIWEIVELLGQECRDMNKKTGKSFDITNSIIAQIPFFACFNHFISNEYQEDIKRFIYCQETNVKPYEGSYEQQPYKWIEKFFIIKNAFAKKEQNLIEKSKKKGK
jgi:hypothetical protein